MNVAMTRNGLILWEDDAMGSRKVSRYLDFARTPRLCKDS